MAGRLSIVTSPLIQAGVGPDIASLSLGSPAQMSWRRKSLAGETGRKGAVDLTITLEHGVCA